jgi:glycosyltransferase involved in cell wall biosynthesis
LRKEALVFYSGVDIEKFSFRGVKEFSKIPEMLSIGIMYPVRKYEILIKAIKTLKDKNINLHLTILGSSRNCPAYAREIKDLVKSLNLKRDVTFLEEVKERELIELYDKADLFAFINHRQSWGNVVFEAMAVGIPVIVSKTVGAVEVLEHKKNAFIIPPNDAETTARAIEELLDNKMLYKKLVENGRKLVENMSWEKMYCERVWNLFKEIHAKKEV